MLPCEHSKTKGDAESVLESLHANQGVVLQRRPAQHCCAGATEEAAEGCNLFFVKKNRTQYNPKVVGSIPTGGTRTRVSDTICL
jgi:hypothetical protein